MTRIRSALVAVVLGVASTGLAACAQPGADVARDGASPAPSVVETTTPTTSPAPTPSPSPSASPTTPPDQAELRGGGYAAALPGSDAPGRREKGDTGGPQIPISASEPNIEEIERLVRAVEKIAAQHVPAQPDPQSGSLAAEVGTFSYRYFADGTVAPDPAWVSANITTDSVPLLGTVTCHRVMLPQLRAALQEVVDRGLAAEIHPGEFAGCYVPRFIERNPSRGLSLHTWGIAVDLNVPGNQRGTVGEISREVVAIFKRWGFAWGGDWAYTDPMHFELAALVRAR
ncbi:MAG TPA: M15 family metallopeptidase [Nocardioidaceae bacterium]|nr:M15 family metallopeptidase [Nocardioidaceae bacterium]